MEQHFRISANISALRGTAPVRFSHCKTYDRAKHHVLHINNYVEIYVYISGNHQYMVENFVYDLRRGDVVIINPLEVHKALPLQEGEYERFYFLVDTNTVDEMAINPLAQILGASAGSGTLISLDDATRESFIGLLYAISDCLRDGRDEQVRAFGYFLQMMSEINRQLSKGSPLVGAVTNTPILLEKILAFVAENTANIQSITEIASAVGVTPQYLSGYFSKHIGTPLKTYIQAKKIALSKELLDKGADVTEACYECGFNDCSYFIRVFKKYVGVTPLAYKTRKAESK